jgi:hypothetical protein
MSLIAQLVAILATALLAPPVTFPAADPSVPEGSHVELCPWFRSGDQARTVSLVLPDAYAAQYKTHASCEWAGAGFDEAVFLDLAADEDLATYKADDIDPFVGDGTDDGIEPGVTYQAGVAVYGQHTGEVLTYQPYNDGSPLDVVVVQAEGVRLEWEARRGRLAGLQGELDRARASLAVALGNRDSCADRGRSVAYDVPAGVRTIDSYGGPCLLELRPGRAAGHLATVTVRPRTGLEALRDRLAARGDISHLRLRDERLDYDQRGPRRILHHAMAQADGIRVEWVATPARWGTERPAFGRLVHSVEVTA